MTSIFITILNMSLTGAFVIIAICLARFVLRKSPKILSFLLWVVAALRLGVPFAFESSLSLMPFRTELIPHDAALIGSSFMGFWLTVGVIVWLCGVATMLFHGAVSFLIIRRRLLKEAVSAGANIFDVNTLKSPFVIGILSPKIYIPALLSPQERRYIILHEQTHIKRGDHIVIFVAYFLLSLHWFNPLVWVAFRLLNMDMEMSCDESVLKSLNASAAEKKDYSLALLSLACEQQFIAGRVIAFSACHVSSRVRNILSTKKQSRLSFGLSVALVLVLCVGLSVNRISADVGSYLVQPVQGQGFYTTSDESQQNLIQDVPAEYNQVVGNPPQEIRPEFDFATGTFDMRDMVFTCCDECKYIP